MLAYQLPSPHRHVPLRRRVSGIALAVAANVLLLLVLLTLGVAQSSKPKTGDVLSVDLIPESHSSAAQSAAKIQPVRRRDITTPKEPLPKPPPIVLPARPSIAETPHSSPWIEMSKEDMAAGDITKLKAGDGSGRDDSEEVGRGPNGEVLYAAEWARRPTNAELGGYLPANAPDGYGLIACKTVADNRVDDCIEIDQSPHGSHLASAVRQAAWQFRVRPPRKNGRPLIGSWVQIRIDYEHTVRTGGL